MTTEAGTGEMGGSRRKEGSYPVADEDCQDGVTVAAPRFARVVTAPPLKDEPSRTGWEASCFVSSVIEMVGYRARCQDSARRDGDSTER